MTLAQYKSHHADLTCMLLELDCVAKPKLERILSRSIVETEKQIKLIESRILIGGKR